MTDVRWTWLPWRRKYRPETQPDGGTLQMLPPERPRDFDAVWAQREWEAWSSGRQLDRHGNRAVCPPCRERGSLEIATTYATGHTDRAARKRWANHADVARAKLTALGACRCGEHRTGLDDADRAAIRQSIADMR